MFGVQVLVFSLISIAPISEIAVSTVSFFGVVFFKFIFYMDGRLS